MKRTHLPLNGLRVLDAAARHLSFTRAADELAVTPAAVGQQIRALEDMLGVVLFRRTPKGLELTDEASAGLDSLRSGFLQFEDAVEAMQASQSSHNFTIAVPRDFAEKWLHHRLADFARDNPDVRFSLVSGDHDIDFTEANLDIAFRLADGPGDLEGVPIGSAEFITVAAPDGPKDWISWPGCSYRKSEDEVEEAVMQVADAGLALQAAIAGFGQCSVPLLLAQNDIDKGRLVAIDEPRASTRRYWLVAPTPQWRQKKVKALVAALSGQ
ncbi:LysR substrate-binding domain-containing protein [Sphingorhabdus sp. Alg239-R122]|uniref:LysR substrate-binding domain-containing protein n=1 Tax=Sphingorhabdus sp. Alg239-R122 TaxID=2305989 RepID=UPI0013DCE57B|nr:LysR substrate-binding domain-containing protein [Sphingorhabdus sp. Alg239-R122]